MATLERAPWIWGIVIAILISLLAMAGPNQSFKMLSYKKTTMPESFQIAWQNSPISPLNATVWGSLTGSSNLWAVPGANYSNPNNLLVIGWRLKETPHAALE